MFFTPPAMCSVLEIKCVFPGILAGRVGACGRAMCRGHRPHQRHRHGPDLQLRRTRLRRQLRAARRLRGRQGTRQCEAVLTESSVAWRLGLPDGDDALPFSVVRCHTPATCTCGEKTPVRSLTIFLLKWNRITNCGWCFGRKGCRRSTHTHTHTHAHSRIRVFQLQKLLNVLSTRAPPRPPFLTATSIMFVFLCAQQVREMPCAQQVREMPYARQVREMPRAQVREMPYARQVREMPRAQVREITCARQGGESVQNRREWELLQNTFCVLK